MSQTPDVLIAGAGVIGMSIAWKLAQAGLKAELLDPAGPGKEASWAGAGMLSPGGEVFARSAFSDLLIHSAEIFPVFLHDLDPEIDYLRTGAWHFASSDSDWDHLQRRACVQRSFGVAAEPDRERRGIWYPNDAYVDPRQLIARLEQACRQQRIVIRQEPVNVLDAANLPAARVVIAAGAWSGAIEIRNGPALRPTKPVRGHLISYSMPKGLLPFIVRRDHTYVFQRRSGVVIAGATEEHVDFDRSLSQEAVESIRRNAEALVPELLNQPIADAWCGFRPAMVSGEPAIGRHADTFIWTAYGHYRNGILGAPGTAELVTAQIIASLEKG
jgi:glycine oxidase